MKRYGQYCPVAHALDQIGDRWALLIVRELLLGQRRFTDLSEALPGIGSNILTARLRSLDAAGIVRKTKLPPPLGVTVYELTSDGRAKIAAHDDAPGGGGRVSRRDAFDLDQTRQTLRDTVPCSVELRLVPAASHIPETDDIQAGRRQQL